MPVAPCALYCTICKTLSFTTGYVHNGPFSTFNIYVGINFLFKKKLTFNNFGKLY